MVGVREEGQIGGGWSMRREEGQIGCGWSARRGEGQIGGGWSVRREEGKIGGGWSVRRGDYPGRKAVNVIIHRPRISGTKMIYYHRHTGQHPFGG